MPSRSEIISSLLDPGIIAVIRTRDPAQLPALAEALIAGGIRALEITMTIPRALEAIRLVKGRVGARGLVGVGTVLDATMCREPAGRWSMAQVRDHLSAERHNEYLVAKGVDIRGH